jgi:MFS transporter, Spinster family, sphingosine-1-phosphate transporter
MSKTTYRHYLLAVLTLTFAFNLLDRLALGLVFEDIRVDLQLSDTQLGFLGGISFALFYAAMGLPIARWADRGNRVTIISLTTALWSVAVSLCGTAAGFVQLLLIRIGVAVGEAGCSPPAWSLIADYYTRAERPRAAAIYGLGGPIAFVFGYFLAGWLNELYGWRVMFMVLGAPGVGLAALTWFTLKEPRLSLPNWESRSVIGPASAAAAAVQPSVKEVCTALWKNATFRNVLLCLSMMAFFTYGIFMWQPTFIMRTYGLTSGQASNWFALAYGAGGGLGSYLGGEFASRYAPQNERLQLRALAVTLIGAGVLSLSVYMVSTYQAAFGLMGVYILAVMTVNGPLFAMMQTLVPEQMRAMAFALMYLVTNLIGMGFGPLVAGALSDLFRPLVGEESLRYALLTLTSGFLCIAWFAWRASNTVESDIAAAQDARERASEGENMTGFADSQCKPAESTGAQCPLG